MQIKGREDYATQTAAQQEEIRCLFRAAHRHREQKMLKMKGTDGQERAAWGCIICKGPSVLNLATLLFPRHTLTHLHIQGVKHNSTTWEGGTVG